MIFHFTRTTRNSKLGPIPVTTISSDSCPGSCPLKNAGCYADLGPLGIHWKKVSQGNRGGSFHELLEHIRKLPKRTLWRYGVAGDLPGKSNGINGAQLAALVRANKGRSGFAYTHKPIGYRKNEVYINHANAEGFTVNLSSNSVVHADELRSISSASLVTLIPHGGKKAWKKTVTPGGLRVVQCPAEYNDTQCITCGNGDPLCRRVEREYVIGFTTHGNRKKLAAKIALPIAA